MPASPGLYKKGIAPALGSDGCFGAVPGVDYHIVIQHHQPVTDAINKLFIVTAGEISPADAVIKQGIAAEQHPFTKKTDAARGMARCMNYGKGKPADRDIITI